MQCATNQAIAHFVPHNNTLDQRFAFRALQWSRPRLIDLGQGGAQQNISQTVLKQFAVPVPPLAEQKRIADKLDTLLARIDSCRERLERLPALIKRFRQAVLMKVVTGSLTEEWRTLNGRSDDDWRETKLTSVAQTVFDGPFGSNLKTADYTSSGERVVRLENIGHLRFIRDKETFVPAEKFEQLSRHELLPNDVLFSSFVDEEVRVCLFPGGLPTRAINKADCFCIRVDTEVCLPEFLQLVLASRVTFNRIKDEVHGSTRPRINLSQLKALSMLVPPVDEQAEAVRRALHLLALIDRIERRVLSISAACVRLTTSALDKAFRGELVPQDPSDEPTAALLSRPSAQVGDTSPPLRRVRKKRPADAPVA